MLAGLFLFSIIVRTITAEYVDIGGDNSEKWRQVHYLVEGLGYTHWYQQTVRWAILLPLAGIMKTFGLNPVLTYIMPIFFASMTAVIICLIGERLHSLELGITSSLATIFFPQMVQTGSQLWPGIFELGYISLCAWLILVWLDERKTSLLTLAALFFFLGWGSRVTMIYAAPGLALLLWLPSRNFKALILVSFIVGGLFLIEWGAFWQIAGNPMGRIGILKSTHIQTAGLNISFTDYLLNIKKITKLKGLLAIWIVCLLSSIWIAATETSRWRAMSFLYLSYSFLLLYMVSGLSPLKLAMPVGTRFWGVIAPFGLLLLMKSLFDLLTIRPRIAKILMAIVFVVFIAFTAKKIPASNSILQVSQDYAQLSPILKDRKPVLMEYEHWQPNLIEEYVISAFTGKTGKRTPREDHVTTAIIRNHARMVALFVDDVREHDAFRNRDLLQQIGDTAYLYTPPNALFGSKPAAKIMFGRKHHQVLALPNNNN